MNGIQIENMLNLFEAKGVFNREIARQEVETYVRQNLDRLAVELTRKGETIIPTSQGGFKLTTADLEIAAAA